jgi:hypothetical protein
LRLENLPLKIERTIFSSAYRLAKLRPSSSPYLSGDGFRMLCKRFYEGETRHFFEPSTVKQDELIFCDAWHLREFLTGPALRIRSPFSVISHNGDCNIDEGFLGILPRNLMSLFSMNVLVRDERVIPLPIGLENKRLHYNGIVRDFDTLRRKAVPKKPRILSAFTIGNNANERGEALRHLSAAPLNDTIVRINSRAYRKIAATYMFIASPPGNGTDCHRTWEAMYLGSVPIVARSRLTESFYEIGLPMHLVSSYEEISDWDEAHLAEIYARNRPRFLARALWMDFWTEEINRTMAEGRPLV